MKKYDILQQHCWSQGIRKWYCAWPDVREIKAKLLNKYVHKRYFLNKDPNFQTLAWSSNMTSTSFVLRDSMVFRDLESQRGLDVLTWPVVHIDLPFGLRQRDPQRFWSIPPERHQAVFVDTYVKWLIGVGVPHVVPDHLMDLTMSACMNRTQHCQFIAQLFLYFSLCFPFIKAIHAHLASTEQPTDLLLISFLT